MIPVTNTITQVDELPYLERIEFSIGDPRFVMMTQAKLYSDVTKAIIREYSTNAYDAHVMAGHRDPIEVTLPSMMSPEFIIRDHGVGMSLDDFRDIYTKFGVSNKRLSNDLNGQLGYGSKSGVAYTTSFQVTSVRGGIKNIAIVHRQPDWTIVLDVLSTERTDEPSGTEIRIPVHNWEEFVHKANEFYSMWLPGRVLVNGKAPEHKAGRKIIDNLYYSDHWSTSYVVMGNVPYRINNPAALFRNTKMSQINFVAYVDDFQTADGQAPVEFTPSREDLEYTERTKATLQAIVDNFEANIIKVAQDEIDTATTHFDAYAKWCEWTNTLGKSLFSELEFNGDKFEAQFKIDASRYQVNQHRNNTYRVQEWDVDHMDTTMVVTNFRVDCNANTKSKARDYAALKDWKVRYVLFTASDASAINSPWITKDRFVDWETLKAALPKTVRVPNPYSNNPNAGRIPGSFDYYTYSGMEREKEVPATAYQNDNLFYISLQDSKRYGTRAILMQLDMKDAVVIILPANRLNKFKRNWPLVKNFATFATDKVIKKSEVLLSQKAKDALDISSDLASWLDKMDASKVDDPEFKRLAGLRTNLKTLTKEYDDNIALANLVNMRYTVEKYSGGNNSFGLMRKYPLLKKFSYYSIDKALADEVTYYINAKYAASQP